MGIITLERSPVSMWGFQIGWHTYLVYKESESSPIEEWKVIRGTRTNFGESLMVEVGLLQQTNDRYSSGETPEDRGSIIVVSGASAAALWSEMEAAAINIASAEYYYSPFQDTYEIAGSSKPAINCNSLAVSLLAEIGVIADPLYDALPLSLYSTPGATTFISGSNSQDIAGSNESEIFFDNGGDDSFVGGGGKDELCYQFSSAGVEIDASTSVVLSDGEGGCDRFTGFETVSGSKYNDTIYGGLNELVLNGNNNYKEWRDPGDDDILSYEKWDVAVEISLKDATVTSSVGFDTFEYFEKIVATRNDDNVIVDDYVIDIDSGDGVDSISFFLLNSQITCNCSTQSKDGLTA